MERPPFAIATRKSVVVATRVSIRLLLAGGDRRSIGRANEVVALVISNPKKTAALVGCLWDDDDLVQMRASDALEKLSRDQAHQLQPYKSALIARLAETNHANRVTAPLRWHLAVIIPRLQLMHSERQDCARILQTFLDDRSSIVKTFAMQGLADLAQGDTALQPTVLELLQSLIRTGTPAMRARGRILLRQFAQAAPKAQRGSAPNL